MGAEAKCTLTLRGRKTEGRALLETDTLIFRGGDVRLSIPYQRMSSVEAKNGNLRVQGPDGVATFSLGPGAARWAKRILEPPTRADKLGIKPHQRVLMIGISDAAFRRELEACGASVFTRRAHDMDVVFYGAKSRPALDSLDTLQDYLKRDGAIWVIRPKGRPEISEADVMQAGRAAGLVDVKVVRFSDTHTAEKFVIPLARR
jgi:hypothetical protein